MSENAIILQGTAGADLTSSQYLWVKADGTDDEKLKIENGPTSRECVGLLRNAPADEEEGWFVIAGVARGVAGGAIEPYDEITNNASGQTVKATTGDLIRGRYIGRFDAAANDQIDVLVYDNKVSLAP